LSAAFSEHPIADAGDFAIASSPDRPIQVILRSPVRPIAM
jgi:hypothetical protein